MKTDSHWKKIGFQPHHGICIPVFALRGQKSCGIGEFLDLLPLIDWCKSIGLDLLQLLPLNDSGDDPSPYNALSSCALDPIYLSLASLPEIGPLQSELEIFHSLNSLQRIPRAQVKHQKLKWLYSYFQQTFSSVSKQTSYLSFLQNNPWLENYTLFKALKDEYGGKRWQDWPAPFQTPDFPEKKKFEHAIDFHRFLQYHCFSQLINVREYAEKRNIFLQGDIPILLSPDSCDVWAHRSLFHLDLAAGAPPDYYNPLGQKWGFPLFNWEEMKRQNYKWWKERLKVAENFFHIYRIDHVVGFFRIWGIPADKKPAEGHFIPADTNLWASQGREHLEMMIDASPLLPIAEDLGTIPREVRPILKELGICRTSVMRWQRHWDTDKSFIPYSEYEPFSLTTVSTPDTNLLKTWWKKHPEESISFAHFKGWNYEPELSNDHLFEILRDSHHTPSFFHINLLQETLTLFSDLSWPNIEDEQINYPGTLTPTNWTYRFRPSLEEILSHPSLANTFRHILNAKR